MAKILKNFSIHLLPDDSGMKLGSCVANFTVGTTDDETLEMTRSCLIEMGASSEVMAKYYDWFLEQVRKRENAK